MQTSESLFSGEETCTVWSNAGSVVQQGSNFTVYCSFKCTASRYPDNISMYRYDSETNEYTEQHLEKHNSTTVSFKVDNITESKTYSCNGECQTSVDPCGLDMKVGCKCRSRWGRGGWGGSGGQEVDRRTERLHESSLRSRGLETPQAVTLLSIRQTFCAIRAASKID